MSAPGSVSPKAPTSRGAKTQGLPSAGPRGSRDVSNVVWPRVHCTAGGISSWPNALTMASLDFREVEDPVDGPHLVLKIKWDPGSGELQEMECV